MNVFGAIPYFEQYGRASKKIPFSGQKKFRLFFAFFYTHIPIEPECSKIDNFYKKWVVVDLPNAKRVFKLWYIQYTPFYSYGSPDYKQIQKNIFYILSAKKIYFFLPGGGRPPHPDSPPEVAGGGVKLCIIFSFLIISIIYEAIMMQFEA